MCSIFTVLNIVVEVVQKSLVSRALIVHLLLHLLRVDRHDNDHDHCGIHPQDRANQEDIVQDFAVDDLVLVDESEDEGDQDDSLKGS